MNSPLSIIRGACGHDCPDTCAWLVEVENEQPIALRGDPSHPFTRGTLCAKVNHYLDRVCHPDRILHPLRRTGPKGQGTFERISWDDALAEIAARWEQIIAKYGAEAILPFSSAGNQGLIQHASLDQRLLGLIGASRLDRNICGAVAHSGLAATQGNGVGVNPEDLVHSRLIVLWGTNTIVTNLHLWPVIEQARRRGAKIVCIDPVCTRTAAASDWHIQIRPGTDTVLALAVMHVIIRDNLVDHDYVRQHSIGYEQLAHAVLKWTPEHASQITGLTAADIELFAREYATAKPSLLRPLIGLEHHRNGAMMFRTIACLPILTGAWRHRGGGLSRSTGAFQYSLLNIDGLLRPETHANGVRTLNMRDLGRDLCSETLSPPIRSLLVWNCNPAATMPNQSLVRHGLERSDLFTIVHDLFLTDTARFADLLLPATSQIEHLDLVPAWGHHYLTINLPAVPPRGESVSNTELFRRLAHALNRSETWLFDSDETLIRTALDSSHPMLAGITFENLCQHGWMHLNHPEDWRPFANGGFPTPSGKAELHAPSLAQLGIDPLPIPGDLPVAPAGMLQLISGKTLHFLNSGYSHIDRHSKREGRLEIDIHPEDASDRRITNGQLVEISNPQGEIAAWSRISSKVPKGVVSLPFGGLVDALGRQRHVNLLTPEAPTDWGGGSGLYDTFVHVNPATDLS
jgi:anaerobic selenocysteine-containing dehydrogenase